MSDKKFNLKTYQKINGSEHIEMRLKDAHEVALDVINEKQLESYRSTEADVVIEKLLEEKRTGGETEITEKRLDTHKSKFANNYRNPSAYEGDMNKLEEQRLMGDPAEKEKYEAASETPKQLRWWDGVKSPDGLKVAKDDSKNIVESKKKRDEYVEHEEKLEEMTFNKPRWEDAEESPEEKVEKDPMAIQDVPEDFDVSDFNVIEKNMGKASKELYVKKQKYLSHPKDPLMSFVDIVLGFDPDAFKGNEEEIKIAAMEKILILNPELSGLISTDDMIVNESIDEGTVRLRVGGEEFAAIVNKNSTNANSTSVPSENLSNQPIEEISYEEKNIEGTPMAIGRIRINTPVTDDNKETLIKDVISFARNQHPRLEIEENTLDLSDLEKGEVRYMTGVMSSEIASLSAESDFDIIVESSLKKN